MKPKSILDPNFKYINANNTDLKKTFARVRREMEKEKLRKVIPIKQVK